MKKLLVLALTMGLVLAVSAVAFAEVKVTVGGEGNFGYNFTKGDDGANFSNYAVTVKAEVAENVSLFGKIKTEDAAKGEGKFFTDEAYANLTFDPVTLKVGYYGFGFGGDKDLLDAASKDFKSRVGLQAETSLVEGLTGKIFVSTNSEEVNKLDQTLGEWAYGFRLDYSQEVFGVGFIYGDTKQEDVDVTVDNATAYSLNAFYKPFEDVKAYVNYSTYTKELITGADVDNANIIIGVLYTPASLPFEFRAEYDLDNENEVEPWTEDFNPWGFRVAYKLNDKTKIQFDRKQTGPDSEETALKLNICF